VNQSFIIKLHFGQRLFVTSTVTDLVKVHTYSSVDRISRVDMRIRAARCRRFDPIPIQQPVTGWLIGLIHDMHDIVLL